MSDLLSSVKNSFFHDVLGCRDAEARLEGREGAYLFRESDVKAGIFVISYVKNSSVSHLVTPNKKGEFIRQTLEEAVEIQRMSLPALSAIVIQFPLPVLVTDRV